MLVAFLYGVVVSLGYMLCVIPGLIVAGLYMLAIPLVVEGRLPATGALDPELERAQIAMARRHAVSMLS